MKKILVLFFSFSTSFLAAQDSLSKPKKSLFAELGGNGGLYSVNFENRFAQIKSSRFVYSAGFSFVPLSGRFVMDVPLSVSWIKGKGKHQFQLGTGQTFIVSSEGKGGAIRGNFRIGYRLEPLQKRHFWLFAYTPNYSWMQNFQYENWIGVSFGYYLKQKK